jgi:hypothetical protein
MLTTKSKAVFLVEGTVEGEQTHVIGRCGESAIQVGEVFTKACRYQPRQSLADFATPPVFVESFPISLHVTEIRAYGRLLEELGPGMTGSLVLVGDGVMRIGPGNILESAIPALE